MQEIIRTVDGFVNKFNGRKNGLYCIERTITHTQNKAFVHLFIQTIILNPFSSLIYWEHGQLGPFMSS